MAGLAALSMERLVISGHYFSTFGKYFMSKETTKHVKNSFACSLCWLLFFHPAAFACLWWPARLQSYQSIQLIIFYQHGFLIIILTISVRLKRITIFASFHFNYFHLPKCRFFAFSRIFDWIHEIFWSICRKILQWNFRETLRNRYWYSDYY